MTAYKVHTQTYAHSWDKFRKVQQALALTKGAKYTNNSEAKVKITVKRYRVLSL